MADIQKLDQKFISIVSNIKEQLSQMIENGSYTITQHIEEYTEEKGFTKVATIDELFNKIKSHYHFLNCHLIKDLVHYFFQETSFKVDSKSIQKNSEYSKSQLN